MSRRRLIKRVGAVKIYRDSETKEYVVRPADDWNDDRAYFTEELDDAEGTAHDMDASISARGVRSINPKRRKRVVSKRRSRYHKPMLTRHQTSVGPLYVEDDGHVFAKANGVGYVGKLKRGTRNVRAALEKLISNPVRVTKKAKKAARSMIRRYGKPRARKVAGGMIGTAVSRRQKEHFVRVRKAMNPVRIRKGQGHDEYYLYTRAPGKSHYVLTVKTNNIGKLLQTAMKMQRRGYGIKVARLK